MLYSELRNYLDQTTSVETLQIFDDAVELFEKYSVEEYMTIFDNAIGDHPNADSNTVVDALQSELDVILTYLITMQGIETTELILPSQKIELANALYDLAHYEDQATVKEVLKSDESTIEKVCVLMCLLTPYTPEALLGLIASVDDRYVNDYLARVQAYEAVVMQNAEVLKPQITNYTAFKKFLANTPAYADKFFQQITSIGLPFEDYLALYRNDRNAVLGEMQPVAIALDLVGLAFLSCDGCNAELITIRKHLTALLSDVNRSTQVDIAVSNLLVEISHAKA